jgi:hypothetical protein
VENENLIGGMKISETSKLERVLHHIKGIKRLGFRETDTFEEEIRAKDDELLRNVDKQTLEVQFE